MAQHRSIRINNTGDVPFSDRYDGQRFTVQPGGDLFVPWEAACLWLGDPTTADLGPNMKFRTDERERVFMRLGMAGVPTEDVVEAAPKLECFNPENGQRITMLVEDPDGPAINPWGEKGEETPAQRLAKAEQFMQAIADAAGEDGIDGVLAKLGVGRKRTSGSSMGTEPPVDTPERPKAGSRR